MINTVAAHILALPGWVALVVVFLLPALESSAFVGFIFPGEIALLLGGVLAYEGRAPLAAVLAAGLAGAVVGDSVGYLVGRRWGRQLVHSSVGRIIKPEHLERGEEYLRTRGGQAVFLGRFTAALRVTIPGLAGMSRMRYRTFAAYNVAGGVVWGTAMILLGFVAGGSWRRMEHLASRIGLAALGVIAILVIVAFVVRRYSRGLARRVADSTPVRRTRERYPRSSEWVIRRFDPTRSSGLPLTIVAATAVGAWWILGGITQDVVGREELARLDPSIQTWVVAHRSAWLTTFFKVVTYLGASVVTLPALALGAFVAVRRRSSWWPLVDIVVVYGATVLAHALLGEAIDRARPPQADWLTSAMGWSYPSGYTAQAVAAWTLLVVLLSWRSNRRLRMGLFVGAALIGVVVGISRIYLGVHWTTDVIGGAALACGILALWASFRLAYTPVALPGSDIPDAAMKQDA